MIVQFSASRKENTCGLVNHLLVSHRSSRGKWLVNNELCSSIDCHQISSVCVSEMPSRTIFSIRWIAKIGIFFWPNDLQLWPARSSPLRTDRPVVCLCFGNRAMLCMNKSLQEQKRLYIVRPLFSSQERGALIVLLKDRL